MSLKKYLKRQEGQSTLEYFILMALLTAFAVIGGSQFLESVRRTGEGMTNFAANIASPPDEGGEFFNPFANAEESGETGETGGETGVPPSGPGIPPI